MGSKVQASTGVPDAECMKKIVLELAVAVSSSSI